MLFEILYRNVAEPVTVGLGQVVFPRVIADCVSQYDQLRK